jgi:condensin-2 complex subunit H2
LQLRQSLINGENETGEPFLNTEDDNVNYDNDFDNGNPDFDMPGNEFMDDDLHPFNKEVELEDQLLGCSYIFNIAS